VGLSTVKDFESGKRVPIPATLTAMQIALEKTGIAFAFAIESGESRACGITYSAPEKGAGL
jgi:hypothetical protein